MSKKTNKQLKRDRQISRDKRNALRREVKENVTLHRNSEVYHLLFISNETENMENVLFCVSPLENGSLINLPIITQQMIDESEEKDPKGLVRKYFGIDSNDIELIDGTKLVVVKNFTVVENPQNLVGMIVRPYNEYTWYNNKCATSLYGERIFKGNKLKDYFFVNYNLKGVFVFQDTITEILIYRSKERKINANNFINNYVSELYRECGVFLGNKKTRPGSGTDGWYSIGFHYDEQLKKILANEKNEIRRLLLNENNRKQIDS